LGLNPEKTISRDQTENIQLIELKQISLGRKEDLPAMVGLDCSDHTIFSYAMRVTRPKLSTNPKKGDQL
jgi:hypothetical protein